MEFDSVNVNSLCRNAICLTDCLSGFGIDQHIQPQTKRRLGFKSPPLNYELQLDNCKLNFNAVKSIDVAVRAKS